MFFSDIVYFDPLSQPRASHFEATRVPFESNSCPLPLFILTKLLSEIEDNLNNLRDRPITNEDSQSKNERIFIHCSSNPDHIIKKKS